LVHNIIRNKSDLFTLTRRDLADLYERAVNSESKRARILVHQDNDHQTHEMIILLIKGGEPFKPHRHPKGKSESYHIIEGELGVNIFDDEGHLVSSFILSKDIPYFRNSNCTWHQPFPVSTYVCYHEVYTGPFDKEKDVEECPWSTTEKE